MNHAHVGIAVCCRQSREPHRAVPCIQKVDGDIGAGILQRFCSAPGIIQGVFSALQHKRPAPVQVSHQVVQRQRLGQIEHTPAAPRALVSVAGFAPPVLQSQHRQVLLSG